MTENRFQIRPMPNLRTMYSRDTVTVSEWKKNRQTTKTDAITMGTCTTDGPLKAGSTTIPPEMIAPLPKMDHISVPVCVCLYSCKVVGLQLTSRSVKIKPAVALCYPT